MNSGNQTPADQLNASDGNTFVNTGPAGAGPTLSKGEVVAERYKVLELLGHGGMGSVYKVEQIFLRQLFALKTLTGQNFPEVAIRRFQKEAQAASKLNHPNLVRAHDFGILSTHQPFFVMDLIEGENLSEYSKRIGTLPLEEVLRIFIPVCFALGYAHSEGIVHRDLKPGNIMLDRSAGGAEPYTPKVVDFGIAKLTDDENGNSVNLTRTGEIFGTPLYMSPEQCLGTKIDHRTDIYSLGCVMYEALTGAPPFHGDSALSLMMKHQSEDAQTLKEASLGREFPEVLESIVRKAMAKDPDQRYQSLLDVAQDLAVLQQDQTGSTTSLSLTKNLTEFQKELPKRAKRISWKSVVAAAFVGILIGAAAGVSLMPKPKAEIIYRERPVDVASPRGEALSIGNEAFVKVEGSGKDAMRVYRFPKNFSLGTIRTMTSKGEVSDFKDARGDIKVPAANVGVELKIKKTVLLANPQLLKGFGEYDINYLYLENDKDEDEAFLYNTDVVFDAALAYASRWKPLFRLGVMDTPVTDVGIRCIQDCPYLITIDVSRTRVTARSIRQLKNFPNLQGIGLAYTPDGKTLLPELCKSKTLQDLNVEGLDITDSDLEAISKIKTLVILNLRANPRLTDAGFAHLKKLPELQCILGGATAMTPASIPIFASLKNLKVVDVTKGLWTAKDIENLKSKTNAKIDAVLYNKEKKRLEPWNWQNEP